MLKCIFALPREINLEKSPPPKLFFSKLKLKAIPPPNIAELSLETCRGAYFINNEKIPHKLVCNFNKIYDKC